MAPSSTSNTPRSLAATARTLEDEFVAPAERLLMAMGLGASEALRKLDQHGDRAEVPSPLGKDDDGDGGGGEVNLRRRDAAARAAVFDGKSGGKPGAALEAGQLPEYAVARLAHALARTMAASCGAGGAGGIELLGGAGLGGAGITGPAPGGSSATTTGAGVDGGLVGPGAKVPRPPYFDDRVDAATWYPASTLGNPMSELLASIKAHPDSETTHLDLTTESMAGRWDWDVLRLSKRSQVVLMGGGSRLRATHTRKRSGRG